MGSPSRRTDPTDERGIALITVMLAMTALLVLSSALVAYGVGSQDLSKRDQRWNAALAAAEAGLDDYLFRLNQNGTFWQCSNPSPPAACAGSPLTQWTLVPASAGQTADARFRYDADVTKLVSTGVIKVTSTGRVQGIERTVTAELRRRSFVDYLYFTDFEILDPAAHSNPSWAEANCRRYYYPTSPRRLEASGDNPRCVNIRFVAGDVINGPLHTNDALLIQGNPRFLGDTSTSWNDPSGRRWRIDTGTPTPFFARAGDPKYLAPLTMPPSNSAMRNEVRAPATGCLYTGPTRIRFNSNGTMTVNSPFSVDTNNAACPKGTGAITSRTASTGSLPGNGVIYVQNVPASSTDPNYRASCSGVTVNGRNHPLGVPLQYDINTYGCMNGDVFVEGTLSGQATVAAENNIIVTHDLKYQGGLGGNDLLGLIANNYVEVFHPVGQRTFTTTRTGSWPSDPTGCPSGWMDLGISQTQSGSTYTKTRTCESNLVPQFPGTGEPTRTAWWDSPQVTGAILAINRSFRVQEWDEGQDLGTLNVNGAIAQRFRGPVGTTGGTGYIKNYVYDQRLKYLSPPKFLDPVASAWGLATWAEDRVPAAYQ